MASVTAARMYVRNLGGVLGLALSSTLVNNSLQKHLHSAGFSTDTIQEIFAEPLKPSKRNELETVKLGGYRAGFRLVFIILAALATVAFLVALALMRQGTVDREDNADLKVQARAELSVKEERRQAAKLAKKHAHATSGAPESAFHSTGS